MKKRGGSRRCFFLFLTLVVLLTTPFDTFADVDRTHWGADQSLLNRKTNIVELRGNAYLSRDLEEITADEIDYNIDSQEVFARGRVTYHYGEYLVRADKIEIDLNSKTGIITNGNVSNGQFALRGKRMEQVGPDRYLVQDYNYTTCLDCPNSWGLAGKSADITVEGYAFIKDFIFKIKGAPFLWFPYMIVPAKTKRQSGLLFPRFGVNQIYGFYFVQPGFIVLNDWADMTLGVGRYTSKGARFEWEGRYALTERSRGELNFFATQDADLSGLKYRYAAKTAITQELPLGFESKLRINEVSDSGYPITYSEDIPGRYDPVLSSDLFFSKNDPELSTVVSLRRLRNLLNFDQNGNFVTGFDPDTVQEFPRVVVNSNDKFLFGSNIAAGVEARFNHFTRASGPFDTFTVGSGNSQTTVQTVREANRVTLIPNLYTTLHPWPWLSFVPSVQYRSFVYNFNGAYKNLARGYLLAQAEMSFQLERVIESDDPNLSYKHTIRPVLTYSTIPTIQESSEHPFVEQVQNVARPGQYFDNWDIVPLGSSQNLESYFTPLGNSLTYGLVSQVFKKQKNEFGDPSVARLFEFRAQQTLDIREAKRVLSSGGVDNRIFLSPFSASMLYTDTKVSWNTEYTYFSFLDRYSEANLLGYPSPHRVSTSLTWAWEQGMKDNILWYERSVGVNYTFSKLTSKVSSLRTALRYSINDYIMPQISYSLDLISQPALVLDSQYAIAFQSPSHCWRLDLALNRSIDRGIGFEFNFALNFAGGGFTTVEQ